PLLMDREPWGRRIAGALGGGWRMFALALLLALVGLFVAGATQPDSPIAGLTPSTAHYFRGVYQDGVDKGTVVLAHHVLLLPNEAMWTLVPSMGGCIGAGGQNFSTTLLCYWRYPTGVSGIESLTGLSPQPPTLETKAVPIGYV